MNKQNVKVTQDGDTWLAEWCDRALDDADRYAPDSIFLYAEGGTEKEMWANMAFVYDQWMLETR